MVGWTLFTAPERGPMPTTTIIIDNKSVGCVLDAPTRADSPLGWVTARSPAAVARGQAT